jgi:predicted Fe-Mo cluster-binding NifX family protein
MIAAIASKGKSLGSQVDDCFGRSHFFVVVSVDSTGYEVVENPRYGEKDAAGVQTAGMLIVRGVDAVAVRDIGHNSLVTLAGAGICVYVEASGSVFDVIKALKHGELIPAESPTVGFQHGLENEL